MGKIYLIDVNLKIFSEYINNQASDYTYGWIF